MCILLVYNSTPMNKTCTQANIQFIILKCSELFVVLINSLTCDKTRIYLYYEFNLPIVPAIYYLYGANFDLCDCGH